jgi:hypothetical protein
MDDEMTKLRWGCRISRKSQPMLHAFREDEDRLDFQQGGKIIVESMSMCGIVSAPLGWSRQVYSFTSEGFSKCKKCQRKSNEQKNSILEVRQ